MTDIAQRNLVAQWAFDTRPVLQRFHLWLENVEVERAQSEPVSDHAFTPREITRCLALTSAATALGTRLFGQYGAGRGLDKQGYNQVKKAADAISAARPGARRENLENYIKRLEKLEEITGSYPGVEKSYAIQAGREVRVMVKPEQVSEDQMVILARELAKKIEEEMEYPGQIKVHVLRETTAVEYAK